jgi:hypothetical protein
MICSNSSIFNYSQQFVNNLDNKHLGTDNLVPEVHSANGIATTDR